MSGPEFDVVISGGAVVDGLGSPVIEADVAIAGDRIVAVGEVQGSGLGEINAHGRITTPGICDIHTHLHAQLA